MFRYSYKFVKLCQRETIGPESIAFTSSFCSLPDPAAQTATNGIGKGGQ